MSKSKEIPQGVMILSQWKAQRQKGTRWDNILILDSNPPTIEIVKCEAET